jgi:uncharacterized membrane protein
MKCKNCGQENPPEASFCSQCGNPLAAVKLEQGVFSAYGNGWRQLWRNFWELLLAGIVSLALTVPVYIIIWLVFVLGNSFEFTSAVPGYYFESFAWGFSIATNVVAILYFAPISFGLYFVYMTAARGDKVNISDIFAAFRNYGNVILVVLLYIILFTGVSALLNFITAHVQILGVLLNIVWAVFMIFISCKVAFVPYLLLDRKMKALESIKTSWEMTNGHAWKVFLIGLLFIPIGILGLICLLVGFIISAMWLYVTVGSLYHAVSTSRPVPQSATPAGPVQPAT